MHNPILLIFGPIGSGKGTQAELLVEAFGIVHITLGDLLREQVAANGPNAQIIQEYMSKGDLVPFDIVDEIVRQRLENPDVEKGMVFDGYPRALPQAKTLVKMLAAKGKKISKVISIKLDTNLIIERLNNRRTCPKCRSIYNVVSDPPKVAGICDKCGTKLIQRTDDLELEAIHERMKVYMEETLPVLKYFGEMDLVEEFDGSLSINELHDKIYLSLQMI